MRFSYEWFAIPTSIMVIIMDLNNLFRLVKVNEENEMKNNINSWYNLTIRDIR